MPLTLFCLLFGQAAGAASGPPLQPTGRWNIDYGYAQCVALRDYGVAASLVTFAIRPAPNGETYELVVGRQRYGPEFAEEFEGSVDFGHGPIKAWLLHHGARKSKVTLDRFRISAQDMAQARSATSVTLRTKGASDITLSLTSMPALLKGLDDCTADLKRYWNMAEPGHSKIAVPAKGDLRRIFSDWDYPSEAMEKHQEGTVQFLLLIDERGKIAACHIARASGVPALDGMGCQVISERAKFKPALDGQGKPVRSSVVTPPVTWRLAA